MIDYKPTTATIRTIPPWRDKPPRIAAIEAAFLEAASVTSSTDRRPSRRWPCRPTYATRSRTPAATLAVSIVFLVEPPWLQALLAAFGVGLAIWMYRIPSRGA